MEGAKLWIVSYQYYIADNLTSQKFDSHIVNFYSVTLPELVCLYPFYAHKKSFVPLE